MAIQEENEELDPPIGCNVKYFVLMILVVMMLMPRFRGGKVASIPPE
jgi:hypothetical protein